MTIEMGSLEQISSMIRERRKSLGISQKRLAKMCGLSQSTIARIETDIASLNPSYLSIFYVVDALNRLKLRSSKKLMIGYAQEIMHRKIIYVKPSTSLSDAIEVFKDYDFPQLPVLDEMRHVVGTLYQKDLLNVAMQNPAAINRRQVSSIMKASLPQIDKSSSIHDLRPILESSGGVIVVDQGRAVGIITIYDILKTV